MYDLDAIEAINIEQLVTPLDRLLLRQGAVRRTRRSFDLAREAELAVAASTKRKTVAAAQKTMYMRAQRVGSDVVGAAAVVAGVTWLSFTLACLLA
jgi:hypothetical protein